MTRKVLVLILGVVVFASCSKTYEYIEVVEVDTGLGGVIKKQSEAKTISAQNDSTAYVRAYTLFCASLKVSKDLKSSMGSAATTPVEFKLIDDNGIDIVPLISFEERERAEREIRDVMFSIDSSIGGRKKLATGDQKVSSKVDSTTVDRLMKKFRKRREEFSNDSLVWFHHIASPIFVNENGLFCYFQTEYGIPGNFRLRYQYFDDSWLFFNKVQFSIDGTAYEFIPQQTKTDSGDGMVWEWFDESIYKADKDLIIALSKAKSAKMRIIGNTRSDTRSISEEEIIAIRETLELFYALGGEL